MNAESNTAWSAKRLIRASLLGSVAMLSVGTLVALFFIYQNSRPVDPCDSYACFLPGVDYGVDVVERSQQSSVVVVGRIVNVVSEDRASFPVSTKFRIGVEAVLRGDPGYTVDATINWVKGCRSTPGDTFGIGQTYLIFLSRYGREDERLHVLWYDPKPLTTADVERARRNVRGVARLRDRVDELARVPYRAGG